MAGGWASFLITSALGKLRHLKIPLASSSAEPQNDVEEGLKKLRRTMLRIQAKLADSEEQEIRDESGRLWFSELKGIAYDAQDAVEEYEYEVLRAEAESRSRGGGCHKGKHVEVCDSSISAPSRISFPDDFASQVKQIRERFDEINREWKALRLGKKHGKRRRDESGNCRQTSSCFDESIVFGREDEKEKLIELLLLSEADDIGGGGGTVSLIPIVGMGGVGKTTLAQLVYNDPRVRIHFDTIRWVCVSEDFDVAGLTRKILVSFVKRKVDYTELNELQQELKEYLQGKKFLLVLDDVWNEQPGLWESVKVPLLKAGVGKVVVTNRNERVARIMQTMEPLNLNVLPFDKCWKLFQKLASLEGLDSSSSRNKLVDIGRQIVEKCKGSPLAVKVIARLLSCEDDEDEWMDVLESELWEINDAKLEILPALKISYDRLPIDLKRCFQYLSLFPKDTALFEGKIVHLWMSQGLLRPTPRSKQAEDIGSDYVRDLVERSILQIKGIPIGHVLDPEEEEEKELVMHDLVHDLAQSVAQGECLSVAANKLASIIVQGGGDGDRFHKVRHLYLVFDGRMAPRDVDALRELKRLRTLVIHVPDWGRDNTRGFLNASFPNFKYLRALDLSDTNIRKLPSSVGDLKLVRYLSFKNTRISSLPESICSLYNLQVLSVAGAPFLVELPSRTVNLPNIRHLMLNGSGVAIPRGLGKLTDLQTLDSLSLGRTRRRCQTEELKGLVNLRGKLAIHDLSYKYVSQTETPLKTKDRLESLELNWSDDTYVPEVMDAGDATKQIDAFLHPDPFTSFDGDTYVSSSPPPPGPQYLSFRGFRGFSIDMDVPSLEELEILMCAKLTSVAGLTNLTSLHSLIVDYCPHLRFPPTERLPSTLRPPTIWDSPWIKQWYERQTQDDPMTELQLFPHPSHSSLSGDQIENDQPRSPDHDRAPAGASSK